MMEYVLTTDDDGHWYVIPADKQGDWWKWVEYSTKFWDNQLYLDNPDLEAPDVPDWADEVGGAPSLVTFREYTIR